jgi:four helix bundle protein
MAAWNMLKHHHPPPKASDMKSHHDLDVWKASIVLTRSIYDLSKQFPKEELYGLTAQMRRAATSVAANIAEGSARQGTREFIQFLYIAVGSGNELDTHIEIAKEIGLLDPKQAIRTQEEVAAALRMLRGLIRSLKNRADGK